MVSHSYTVAFLGVEAREVDVQCQLSAGLPAFHLVGLPDKAVAESRERVRAALNAIGLALPPKRITVNLAPADLPKEGAHFDLPIALALMAEMEVIPREECAQYIAIGELGLDAKLNAVAGALVGSVRVLAPRDLISLINHFSGRAVLTQPTPSEPEEDFSRGDMAEVRGQEKARRALEVSMIHSVAGKIKEGRIPRQRPYCDPHHSASMAAIVGGGRRASPGQISLAHNGVLFLDELPEFARPVLESLREPLETGQIVVARANAHICYPSRVQLIAAMNPCRCGWLSNPSKACSKAPNCGLDYQARLSGPLLDRIDIQVETPQVSIADLAPAPPGESSAVIGARVARARIIQAARFERLGSQLGLNSAADGAILDEIAPLSSEASSLLTRVAEKFGLSARAYHRVRRLARTIADLEGVETIAPTHIAEAASFRRAPIHR